MDQLPYKSASTYVTIVIQSYYVIYQSLEHGKAFHTCSTAWPCFMAAEKTVQCSPNTKFPMYKDSEAQAQLQKEQCQIFQQTKFFSLDFYIKISHLLCLKLL